jgi:hypothetical protein
MGARAAAEHGLVNLQQPTFNCVITNVPGSQEPLYCAGAQILHDFGTGPVIDSNGLFHAIKSYHGEMTIAVTACREMMPDPARYVECLRTSYDELHRALLRKGRKAGTAAKRETAETAETAKAAETPATGSKRRSRSKKAKAAPAQSRTTSGSARGTRENQ